MADQNEEMEKILSRLHSLEERFSRLESAISTGSEYVSNQELRSQNNDPILAGDFSTDEEKGLESQIGRFGLAWLGNIVLLFGIAFLSQYMMNLGYGILSLLTGYFAAAGMIFLANYIRKTNDHLSSIFRINAFMLLFYITVRLHFFSVSPLVSGRVIPIILLLLFTFLLTYLSIRDRSRTYAVLALLFSLITAILGDNTHFTLPTTIITAAGVIFLYQKYKWGSLLILTIFLTYVVFVIWLFGNPILGHHNMQLLNEHQYGAIYLIGIGACFSLIPVFRKIDSSSDEFFISVIIINGILFTLLLLSIVFLFYSTNYVTLFSAITAGCIIYSIILHSRSDWNFASAFYALYGFMAMSIALYGIFGFPVVYLLLSLQSLLVVSLALLFRNRLIIIMNSILFLTILLIYLVSSTNLNGVNFSFAFIALISARIINWKKSRLQIETDLIRNLYMIEGFIIMLLALYHAVPKQFITFSWSMMALIYFVVSLILGNIKYRYMALGTMICSAFYLFIIDLARIELIYRILALLFLATISIGISIYYTNRIKNPPTQLKGS